MSFTATVENDVIKLPMGAHLPNGSTVRVELVESIPKQSHEEDWITRSVGVANSGMTSDEILKMTRGDA